MSPVVTPSRPRAEGRDPVRWETLLAATARALPQRWGYSGDAAGVFGDSGGGAARVDTALRLGVPVLLFCEHHEIPERVAEQLRGQRIGFGLRINFDEHDWILIDTNIGSIPGVTGNVFPEKMPGLLSLGFARADMLHSPSGV